MPSIQRLGDTARVKQKQDGDQEAFGNSFHADTEAHRTAEVDPQRYARRSVPNQRHEEDTRAAVVLRIDKKKQARTLLVISRAEKKLNIPTPRPAPMACVAHRCWEN